MSQSKSRPSLSDTAVLDIVINAVLPYLIYRSFASQIGEWQALALASAPPLVKSGRDLILRRRIDTIAILALASILFSLLSLLLGGSARALLLRGSVITGLFGLFYLASLFRSRPLIYYIVRFLETGDTPTGLAAWNRYWTASAKFRSGMRLLTVGWGVGLLVQALLGFVLLQVLSIERFLIISSLLGYAFNFGLIAWSIWYGNRMKHALQP